MKKIAIFQADLKVGGIQRSLVNLLSSPILNNYEIDLFLFSREIFYDIDKFKKNVNIHFLKPFPYWFRLVPFFFIRHMSFYTGIQDQYEYVFDFDGFRQECAYCATRMKKAAKILWIHNDIEKELQFKRKYRILFLFFKDKYKFYDKFVAVSEGVVNSFKKCSRCHNAQVIVIPNIINVEEILDKSRQQSQVKVDPTKCNIVCVGRIYIQKGYDLLLQDFYTAYQKRKDLRCYIIGDGPDYLRYIRWVKAHGLQDVVYFLGNQKNPFSIMNQMDAFCLESRSEGQGMVLWEAKCLGLQLIFPKRLEKYNIYLEGVENVSRALIDLKKKGNEYDYLHEYHDYVEAQYDELLQN